MFLAISQKCKKIAQRTPDKYLGAWCIDAPINLEHFDENQVLEYPFSSIDEMENAVNLCSSLTDELADIIVKYIKIYYNTLLNHDKLKVLLWPPVEIIVMKVFHNYRCILKAVEIEEAIDVIKYNQGNIVKIYNTDVLIKYISSLEGDIFINNIILSNMKNINFIINFTINKNKILDNKFKYIFFLKESVKNFFNKIFSFNSILSYQSPLNFFESFILLIRSKFKIGFLLKITNNHFNTNFYNSNIRDHLLEHLIANCQISPLNLAVCHVLVQLLPIGLFEKIKLSESTALKLFPMKPEVIVGSLAWVDDDLFRLWALACQMNATKLVSFQHGGGHGLRKFLPLNERFEYRFVDFFFGWGDNFHRTKNFYKVAVPPHFYEIKAKIKTESEVLLYCGTSEQLFPFQIKRPLASMQIAYVKRQIEFFNFLPEQIKPNYLMRANPTDGGWNERKMLELQCPNIKFDDFSVTFLTRVTSAKIVIVDNLNTTFLQTMASNVPTILVWDPSVWLVDREFKFDIDELVDAKILFTSVELAVVHLGMIWDAPQAWWHSEHVQNVVKKFLVRYFRMGPNFYDSFLEAIGSVCE